MKYALLVLLSGCTTIVTSDQIDWCHEQCFIHGGVAKVGKKVFADICCECSNGKIIRKQSRRFRGGRY